MTHEERIKKNGRFGAFHERATREPMNDLHG